MAIQESNGDIIINHSPTPTTLTYAGEDSALGIEKFSYADSTLKEEHALYKRDYGRKVSGGLVTRKGKITIVQEKVLTDGTRRSYTQSLNLLAHSDFDAAVVQQALKDLGQFLLDNSADLAAGLFDS
jgi:hypothetical protein